MAKAEGIPPTASVASVGPGLRYIGEHAYALSGQVTDAASGSAATTCLDYTSGEGYIIAKFAFGSDATGADTQFIDLSFNDLSVFKTEYDNSPMINDDQILKILIPPLTHVIWKWGISSGTKRLCVVMTGRVYGV